ncbi:MAG: type I DNA topoisomerase [Candidatus Dormibacteria bacterium]|jgi:DNA topoisomerase-1
MPNHLIIVESPSKARTLAKFLGAGYTVKASMGHVRDLPKSKMGVDVERGFEPEYGVIRGKEKQIKELRDAAKRAEQVYLAADPDREGEAIAWHIAEALKLSDPDRIVVHEITKSAVEAALKNPRKIDRNLVYAQEARRVIDRLVGYRLSPLLWRKVRTGLSAGRVQSVAVRLVVDRENEIDAFVPVESWSLDAVLEKGDSRFTARLQGRRGAVPAEERAAVAPRRRTAKGAAADDTGGKGDRLELPTQAEAFEVLRALRFDETGHRKVDDPPFEVEAVETSETMRSAPFPHTTSTLQQDASTRLRFSPRRTMSIAQELYEGVDLGSSGPVGLITYMRTDSTRISDQAREEAARHITASFGKQYVHAGQRRQRQGQNVQDAHEAIRPTDVSRTPDQLEGQLSREQARLYDLIWRRFVSSQMAAARFLNTRAAIASGDYLFRATGSVLLFDGFQRVWKREEEKDKEGQLPALAAGDRLACVEMVAEQHFTQPPSRYTEASLIKEMEERGIGRPSTYAPTIEVIQERAYVRQEERRLQPTELGKTVDGLLREHFPEIVDVDFTADLERRLDGIEGGTRKYEPTVRDWYTPFDATVVRAEATMQRVKVPAKPTGEKCPECGVGELVLRQGRFGEFVGCSRYPECSYIKDKKVSTAVVTGEVCPQCGKPLVQREGRRGPFVGCSGYPKCRFIRDLPAAAAPASTGAEGSSATGPSEALGACPECGKPLARKDSRRGSFVGCTGYPGCKYIQPRSGGASTAAAAEPTGEACPDCGKPLVRRQGRFGPFVSCSGYPGCKYRPPKASPAPARSRAS